MDDDEFLSTYVFLGLAKFSTPKGAYVRVGGMDFQAENDIPKDGYLYADQDKMVIRYVEADESELAPSKKLAFYNVGSDEYLEELKRKRSVKLNEVKSFSFEFNAEDRVTPVLKDLIDMLPDGTDIRDCW